MFNDGTFRLRQNWTLERTPARERYLIPQPPEPISAALARTEADAAPGSTQLNATEPSHLAEF